MCGRYTQRTNLNKILDQFAATSTLEDWPARYNISPTQQVLVMSDVGSGRTLAGMRWGLMPKWAKYLPL